MEEITKYTLFPNSNELLSLKGYGIVSAVAHLLVKFNRTNSKDIFKSVTRQIKIDDFGTYEIGIFRATDKDYRVFYKSITERFCDNPALYKKVFGCFSAWCTDNDTTKIVCDIEDIMKYGYEKTEGGRRYHYASKMEFSRAVYDLCALQFFAEKTGSKGAGTFQLLQGTFFVDSGEAKIPVLKKINLEYCAGLDKVLFQYDAINMPKKSLKMSLKKPDTYELGEYIQSVLNVQANKGHKGKMFTVSSLAKYVGKTNPYKRLIEKLNTIKDYFSIQYVEQTGHQKIFIWSDFLPIKTPSKRKKVAPKKNKNV